MTELYATLPLQHLCQLLVTGCPDTTGNTTPDVNPSPLQVQSATLPDGLIAYPDVGKAYKVSEDNFVSWKVARERCISEGGHLAVIDTRKKYDHVMDETDMDVM